MDLCTASEYGKTPGATAEELRDFISRNKKWHNESNTESSTAFTPEFIDEFISKTADEYTEWKILQEIAYYNFLPVVFDSFIEIPDLSEMGRGLL